MRHGLAPGSKAAGGTGGVLVARLSAGRCGESHAKGGLDGAEGCATRRAPPRRPRAPGCLR